MTIESPYLTVEETAIYLRCTRRTVEELLLSGRIEAKKIGRRWLITREAIENSLQSNRKGR